jgi:glycerol-3-phosphate acyltransferase PlsY
MLLNCFHLLYQFLAMNYIFSALIGFILGSFPTAYLVIKGTSGIDIREAGSKNVGTRNVYRLSKSKPLTLTVLIIDMGKGALSVYIPMLIFDPVFIFPAISSVFAIFAHCFNPWLGFKGGRGLATAAGSSIIIFPYCLMIWIVLWLLFYIIKKNILFSNIGATIMSVILIFNIAHIAVNYTNPTPESESVLILYVLSIFLIIFIKHIEPFKELIYKKNIFRIERDDKK